MANALGVGIHRDVPMETYVADPCPEPSLSSGTIHRLITQSPAHARFCHPRLNPLCPPDESTRADMGSAIHSAILGGQPIVYAPAEYEDWRTKDARSFRDEARAKGQLALLEKNREQVEGARDAAMEKLATLPDWNGQREVEGVMVWKDGPTWKRGRYDLWQPAGNRYVDVKTTTSAEPAGWIRSTLSAGGYDIQAEHYLDGARVLQIGDEATEFLFLLVEIEPPFECSFVGLGPMWSDLARRKVARGTALWRDCIEADHWPGYRHEPHFAEPPPWLMAEAEEAAGAPPTKYSEERS